MNLTKKLELLLLTVGLNRSWMLLNTGTNLFMIVAATLTNSPLFVAIVLATTMEEKIIEGVMYHTKESDKNDFYWDLVAYCGMATIAGYFYPSPYLILPILGFFFLGKDSTEEEVRARFEALKVQRSLNIKS